MNKKLFAALAVLLLLTSCVTDPRFYSYVTADRAEFDVTKEHYAKLMKDANVPEQDVATHMGRLQAREQHIIEAEKYLGIVK